MAQILSPYGPFESLHMDYISISSTTTSCHLQLQFELLPISHAGKEVSLIIKDTLEEYRITSKLGYMFSDSHGADGTLNSHLSNKLQSRGILWDLMLRPLSWAYSQPPCTNTYDCL